MGWGEACHSLTSQMQSAQCRTVANVIPIDFHIPFLEIRHQRPQGDSGISSPCRLLEPQNQEKAAFAPDLGKQG